MKIQKIFLLSIFFSFCLAQNNIYQSLLTEAQKTNDAIPGNSNSYITGISTKVASVSNSIDKNTLDSLLGLAIPSDVVNFFKTLSNTNIQGTTTYNNYSINGNQGLYIKGVAGISFNGNEAQFSYIEARAQGTVVQQKEKITKRECHRNHFRKKCKHVDYWVDRNLNGDEVNLIGLALAGNAIREVKSRINSIIEIFSFNAQMTLVE